MGNKSLPNQECKRVLRFPHQNNVVFVRYDKMWAQYFPHLCLVVQRTDLRQNSTKALSLLQEYESAYKKRMITIITVPKFAISQSETDSTVLISYDIKSLTWFCYRRNAKFWAEFGYGKYLIVPFWYASAAYQASLVEPWFVFWRDAWRDQTSLICRRSVPKRYD